MGLLWLGLFIADIIFDETLRWTAYFKIVMACLFLFQYFYGTTKPYFEITDQYIRILKIFSKEIKIRDITEINKKFDEYEIKSDTTTIKISTQNLDQEHKILFEEKIEEIRLQLNHS